MVDSSFVYLIENIISGKCYVGKTNNVAARWVDHCRGQLAIDRAIRRHGRDSFVLYVIAAATSEEEAYLLEEYWEARLREFGVALYNLRPGGRGGFAMSEETKQKLREAKEGVTLSSDHKDKISRGLRGLRHSTQTKEKIAFALRKHTKSTEHIENLRKAATGKSHTEETRQKLAEINRQRSPDMMQKMRDARWKKP